jgi:LacI family transcriptional regulator
LRNRLTSERPARSRRITLADVALHAGVSASTASRALNGRGELSPATRAAVLEAAEALRFQPSALARSLRTRTTYTVGFVVPDIASPFYAACLKGAQQALEEAGYRVMLMDSEQTREGELAALRTLLAHRVDGLLVATTGLSASRFGTVVDRGTPCVFFDSLVPEAGAGSVTLANEQGIDQLVDHVAAHGHRRIALLAGSQSETSGRERLAAFGAAMRRRGLRVETSLVRRCRWSQDDARRATLELLALERPPSAVVASSAELALGCLAACRQRGVSLPGELALVSFDDPYFGGLLEPPLTAVGYDPGEVGRAAAALLVEAMQEPGSSAREVTIPVTLVRRRSCGCPPEPERAP